MYSSISSRSLHMCPYGSEGWLCVPTTAISHGLLFHVKSICQCLPPENTLLTPRALCTSLIITPYYSSSSTTPAAPASSSPETQQLLHDTQKENPHRKHTYKSRVERIKRKSISKDMMVLTDDIHKLRCKIKVVLRFMWYCRLHVHRLEEIQHAKHQERHCASKGNYSRLLVS